MVASAVMGLLGIDQHGEALGLGQQLMHETEPFGESISLAKKLMPVALAPLAAPGARYQSRAPTGSSPTPNTIGMADVAALAASEPGVLAGVAMTATWRLTASPMIAGSSS